MIDDWKMVKRQMKTVHIMLMCSPFAWIEMLIIFLTSVLQSVHRYKMHRTFRELVKETHEIYTIALASWVRGEVQSTLCAPRYVI